MKKNLLLFSCMLLAAMTYAQRAADKTVTFDNPVKDLLIVPFNGIAIVSEGTKIHGYDPSQDKIIWSAEAPQRSNLDVAASVLQGDIFGAKDPKAFNIVDDTPFVQKYFDGRLYVYNSFDGKLLFEAEENEKYFQVEYLFDENSFLLRGVQGKELFVTKYDISSGSTKWKTTLSNTFGEFMQNLVKLAGNKQQTVNDKLDYTDDRIFTLIKSRFYVLNKKSGELLWKAEEDKVKDFKRSKDGSKVLTVKSKGWLGGKSILELYDTATGKAVWKDPLTTKALVLFEDWENRMLLAHYKGFNFYDYETGEKVWKKDPKGKGIKAVIPVGTDFLYVYDDEMMLIDKNGQKMWKNDVTISDDEEDPIFFLEKTKNGKVLYVTSTYANLVDYKTGKKIWRGNLKLNEKRPTIAKYDEKSSNFIIFNDEELYKFSESTADKPKPFAKMKLKNEKLITGLELFENNISISGQSEVVGVDYSGNVTFHKKYVQPGELGRRLLKTGAILGQFAGGVAAATVTTSYRNSNGEVVARNDEQALFGERTKAIGEAGFMAGAIGQSFVQNRFNAMQETKTYAIIFAKSETNERSLIRVSKETGEELDKILVENVKPVYDVDHATNDIYYSKKNEVKIFKGK